MYGFKSKQAQRLILSGKSFQIAVILEDRTGRSHVNKRRRLSAGEKYGVIEEAQVDCVARSESNGVVERQRCRTSAAARSELSPPRTISNPRRRCGASGHPLVFAASASCHGQYGRCTCVAFPRLCFGGDAWPRVPLRSTRGYSWCQLSELAFQPVLVSRRALGAVINGCRYHCGRKRSLIDIHSTVGKQACLVLLAG